jgi:hypothetical protein
MWSWFLFQYDRACFRALASLLFVGERLLLIFDIRSLLPQVVISIRAQVTLSTLDSQTFGVLLDELGERRCVFSSCFTAVRFRLQSVVCVYSSQHLDVVAVQHSNRHNRPVYMF